VWTSTLRLTGTIDLEVVALSSLWHSSASNFNVFFSVADPYPNPDPDLLDLLDPDMDSDPYIIKQK
jgi:hypothetical protein